MADFAYEPLASFGEDETEYELVTSDFVSVEEFLGVRSLLQFGELLLELLPER